MTPSDRVLVLQPNKACSNQFVLNINNNSGTVVVGCNNAVHVHYAATVSDKGLARECTVYVSNERGTEGDGKPCVSDSTDHNFATKSQINNRVPHASGGRLTKGGEPVALTNFFRKRKKRKCCHGAAGEKKQRSNSRCSTPSSGDDDLRDPTLNELALENDSSGFERALQIYHCCITPLHPLRDNGLWTEFDRVAQELLDAAADNVTHRVVIFLEKSVALMLKKELEAAEGVIDDVVKEIQQTSGSVRLLLEVLSNCYLALLYRRRKMLGKTKEYLEIARKIASGFPPCLAVVILLYEEGSYKRDIASIFRKDPFIAEANELMERCVDLCCRLDREEVYVRKQHFAVSKMALMNLHCETSVSRSKSINPKNIVEAGKRLETLHTEYYVTKEVQGSKIQRLIANVDLSYRLEKYLEAETIAQEALEMAKALEFNLDVVPLEDRLTDIRRKITESSSSEPFREIPRIIDSSSGSSKNNSPYTSEYEEKL